MSKMDLVKDKKGRIKREVGRYLDPDPDLLLDDVNRNTNPKFHALNKAVVTLVSWDTPQMCIALIGNRSKIRVWYPSSLSTWHPKIRSIRYWAILITWCNMERMRSQRYRRIWTMVSLPHTNDIDLNHRRLCRRLIRCIWSHDTMPSATDRYTIILAGSLIYF